MWVWFANFVVAVIAALHIGFMALEMFFWTKPLGIKIFHDNSPEKAARAREFAALAANQGLYNGFLALGLFYGLVHPVPDFAFQIKQFCLLCVIAAGIYGAATVKPKILIIQAAPAALALILIWVAYRWR
ncbi:MAG: putative rane protein [Bradyrhizobium sp.]|jgi:putative membrane protein|nr:putative rane protein [Bradyrhizobium sp.]